MRFEILKDKFIKGLQMVQSVISTHATIPVLYNVHLNAEKGKLNLTATDLNVSMRCSVEADVKKGGSTTLQARRLLSIIRELPKDSVEVDIDDKNVASIRCGASNYKIFGISSDEFPPLPGFEGGKSYLAEQNTIKEMFKKTVYAVSDDESRHILNGILLSFIDQKLVMVATDGRRLSLIEKEMEIPVDARQDVVVPTKTVNELIRTLKDEGQMKIYIVQKMVAFETDDLLIVSKLIDGTYPNYSQVIPTKCDERVSFEREVLLSAVRRVALLVTERANSIRLSFDKNQLQVSAITPDVGEANEAVPVKYSGKPINMAFNPEFLMDPLRNLDTDEIYLEMTDDLSPAVIKSTIPFLYVLMPLRVS